MERVVDDPEFELPPGRNGRCRVQIIREQGRAIVLLTQRVDSGGGYSLANGAEEFADAVRARYLPDLSRRPGFIARYVNSGSPEAWPDEHDEAHQIMTVFAADGSPDWTAVSDTDALTLRQHAQAGRGAVTDPPTEPDPWTEHWLMYPGARLPAPTRLFRAPCMTSRLRRLLNRIAQPARLRACSCKYHATDWRTASRLAIEALHVAHDQAADTQDANAIGVQAALHLPRSQHPESTLHAARSLLLDAIDLTEDGEDYVNGQHRSVAMRDQRVKSVPLTMTTAAAQTPPAPTFVRAG